jgi:L-amino acid N-acyltransferase YncA
MKIVKAKRKDLKFLLQIYNFYVEKNLFSSKRKIEYLDHKKWFEQDYLKKKKIFIFISKVNNIRIGYVRYKYIKKNIFEVSIALKKNYTGQGLGLKFLSISLKKFLKKKNYFIISKVKKNNRNSISCFIKNNFKKLVFRNDYFNLKNRNDYFFFKYVDKKTLIGNNKI